MLFNLYGFLLRKAVFLLKKPRVSVMAPRPGGAGGWIGSDVFDPIWTWFWTLADL